MNDIARWFTEGGWPMYPILLLGLVGVPGSLAALVVPFAVTGPSREKVLLGLAIAGGILGLATMAVGFGGHVIAMRQVEAAVAMVNPADREMILQVGGQEARVPLYFGLGAGAPPLVVGMVLLMLSARPRSAAHGEGSNG